MSDWLPGLEDRIEFYRPPDQALPFTNWKAPIVSELPSWRGVKRLGIDVETRDEDLKKLGPGIRRDPKTNYVVGVSFAIEDGPEFYLPVNHHGGDNCEGDVFEYLRDQFRVFDGILVGANIGYDADWLETRYGCDVLDKRMMDVQVADPLIYELYNSYSLEAICNRYDLPGKDERILRDAATAYRIKPKEELWKLPARFVGPYGAADARRPLQIIRRQEQIIESEGIQQIWDLERKVTPILVKMRQRGVRINTLHLEAIERLAYMTEAECLDNVRIATGVKIDVGDVWKSAVLAHALKAKGHNIPLTPKTKKPSIDKDFLQKRCGKVGAEILRAREWNKLRTTFVAQVRRALIGDRVHCTYNQLRSTDDYGDGRGVRYGRLSSSNFNTQQQPIRHEEFGKMWREVFVPDHGARWACSDWSQQEPRIGVHYAEALGLPGATEFAQMYRDNPALDIHQKLADLADMERYIVKNFVNGRLYGMGDAKLCRQINRPLEWKVINGVAREVPGPEGRAIIDRFNQYAPWIAGLTKAAAKAAEKNGHVWTILRRKCHFERSPTSGQYEFTHKAFNRVGQGSAADQMKATLVAADAEGIPIQMAVHDEFDLSWTDEKVIRRLKELQMTVVKFRVPMKVDLEVGPSWGELEKLT